MDIEFEEMDLPTVTVTDKAGRSLSCYIEHSLQLKEGSYVVLMPVDIPVEFFAWSDDEDDEELILIETDAEIEVLYPIAKAVLAEQNIDLHRSAFTLTVSGEVPDLEDEDEDYGYEPEDANGTSHDSFQLLADFFYNDQEYAVCAPLEPVLILARMVQGKPKVLEGEELNLIQPILEEYLAGQLIETIEEDEGEEDDDFDEEDIQ